MDYFTTRLLSTLSNRLADVVEQIEPVLVMVKGRQGHPASGVVFRPDLVLTANHVLERQESITIQTHEGNTFPASLVGRDPASDLALLRVDGLRVYASVATIPTRVGQLVLAVGRLSRHGPTVSGGFISAINGQLRTARGVMLEQYLRTDTILSPGFSGGALIDMQGGVIGIVTSGLVSRVALAIPVAVAWRVGEELVEQGYVKRAYLGIGVQQVRILEAQRGRHAQECGLLIVHIADHSPAARSGLLIGDILIVFNGQTLVDADDLQLWLTGNLVGKTVSIEIIRGTETRTIELLVGQRASP